MHKQHTHGQILYSRRRIIRFCMQVALRQFKLRTGSGGSGRWHGGEGVIREVGGGRLDIMSLLVQPAAISTKCNAPVFMETC